MTAADLATEANDGSGNDYHPFIAGLLQTLPPAEADWPMDARRRWLLAAVPHPAQDAIRVN